MTTPQRSSDQAASGADDPSPKPARIVVGVDGSEGSIAALRWAAQEAGLRGIAVHVVMAWLRPTQYGFSNVFGAGMSYDIEKSLATAAAEETTHLVEEVRKQGDVTMTWETIEGHPAAALLAVVEDTDILVVGSRGHGGFVSALLGSVSQHVVAHAPCPVVVIPGSERRTRVDQT